MHSTRAVASLVPVGNGAGPLEVVPGPRTDSFTSDALVQLTTADFTVDPASSRVGVRLQGPTLGYRPGLTELRSEGMVAGEMMGYASSRYRSLGHASRAYIWTIAAWSSRV